MPVSIALRFGLAAFALACGGAPAFAETRFCMEKFYKAPNTNCLVESASVLDHRPQADVAKYIRQDEPFVGFFAAAIVANPQFAETVAVLGGTLHGKYVIAMSLCLAGRGEDAKRVAASAGVASPCAGQTSRTEAPIRQVRSVGDPGTNDMLIAAFSASGDTLYIDNILSNFADVSPSALADAIRYGVVVGKLSDNPKYAEHFRVLMLGLCAKYECRANTTALLRIITLATAYWGLDSISERDEKVAKSVASYFEAHPQMKSAAKRERAVFANYLLQVNLLMSGDHDEGVAAAVSDFETFKPADEIRFPTDPKSLKPAAPTPTSRG